MKVVINEKVAGFNAPAANLFQIHPYMVGSRYSDRPERILFIAHTTGIIGIVLEADGEIPGKVFGWSEDCLKRRPELRFYGLRLAEIEELSITLE